MQGTLTSIANCFFAETPGRLEDAEELEKCVSGQKALVSFNVSSDQNPGGLG